MSEMQRHTDAVDEELSLHNDNARSLDALEQEVALAKLRARHEAMRAATVVGVLLIALVFLCIYTVVARNNDGRAAAQRAQVVAESNGTRLQELSAQLDEARRLLDERSRADSDVVICQDRFTNLQRSSNLDAFAVQEELIVALIPADPPEPADVRRAKILDIRTRLDQAIGVYRAAITRAAEWTSSGYGLPCPLPGG